MSYKIGELLSGKIEFPEEFTEDKLHRTKVIDRPTVEVSLGSLYKETRELIRTKNDPTEDLIELPKGALEEDITICVTGRGYSFGGYIVFDNHTEQTWYAHDKLCLDKNFVYRDDLLIKQVNTIDEFCDTYVEVNKDLVPGVITSKVCYILDNPGNETYEVYYESNYPSIHYGKATPQGCFINKYKNRFYRDMAILELDELYTNSSYKDANKLSESELKANEAIVISDGAWMNNVCTCAFFYIDCDGIKKQSSVHLPTEPDQAVLIAELTGAYEALKMCYLNHKTSVTYYYDNTSVVNCFNNKKTEYIAEVKKFKDFAKQLDEEGYSVNFVEIHPKTDENKDKENKALMFFHNSCDSECRLLSDIFKKDYKIYANMGKKDGKLLSEVRKGAPKKQFNKNYRKPQGNVRR